MNNWWRTDEELMKNWWRTDEELMKDWWRTDDEQMMNWWWTDDEQLMNWWWTAGLVWCAKDYHRLPQTATEWFYSIEHSKLSPGIGLAWILLHISLTPPTTRAPLAVLKKFVSQKVGISQLSLFGPFGFQFFAPPSTTHNRTVCKSAISSPHAVFEPRVLLDIVE